jgi:hypothetical protein
MMQHPVGSEHLEAIGDITVPFTMLEAVLQSLVHTLLGGKVSTGQAVTVELSFKNLRVLAASLWVDRFGKCEETVEFVKLMARIRNVEEQRNQVTHSVWAGNDDGQIVRVKTTAKEGRGGEMKHFPMSAADLNKIAAEIKRLATDVQRTRLSLRDQPSHRRP